MNVRTLKHAIKDYDKRALLFTAGGLFTNICFIVLYAVFCAIDGAKWYSALLSYFAILAAARAVVLGYSLKGKFGRYAPASYEEKRRASLTCGILSIVLSLVIAEEIVIMTGGDIRNNYPPKYFDALIYINSIYLFVRLGFAIYNTAKNIRTVSERENPLIASGKFLSLCDCAASLLVLQNAVLIKIDASLTTARTVFLTTGSLVRLLMIATGVYMIVVAQRMKKRHN